MSLEVKIIRISIYYLMFKHLYNMALNFDVAFLLSVSIEYKLGGILTSTVCSVVAGHVVIASYT